MIQRFRLFLTAAIVIRIVLIFWGQYQDKSGPLPYTDIDYHVFTDSARCLLLPASTADCTFASGPLARRFQALRMIGDPYARDTYRYTPLLSILVSPNILLNPLVGKFIFAMCDLIVGILLYHQLVRKGRANVSQASNYVGGIWLLNPIIANISTRGSAESVLGVLVIATLVLAEKRRWDVAAAMFGLAVHFKVYPIIYGSSLLAAIGSTSKSSSVALGIKRDHIRFGMISFASFMLLNAIMYSIWGQPFLEHTFLYHIHRLDHRHNFSLYFYSIYLSSTSSIDLAPSLFSSLIRHPLAAFIPQLSLSIGLGFLFGDKDLPFAWFVQTVAFVTFNKVCTSQYFLWYLWLLPLIIPSLTLQKRDSILLVIIWIASQAIWLSQAFRLEMQGVANYFSVWMASIFFFVSNVWILSWFIGAFNAKSSTVTHNVGNSKKLE